jgi:hypothetical protein
VVTVRAGGAVVVVVVESIEDVLVDMLAEDNNPQDTRLPALLCAMKGLPSTSVLSEETENTKLAPPNESVLL